LSEKNKMQIDEQLQRHIFSLPTDLKAEVLDFVLRLEKRREREAKAQDQLMATIKAIKPVKVPLSSEEMVRLSREGKGHEIARIIEAKKGHTPMTQKFIGLLAGTNLDESN
jgi:hypothetical protein